MAEKDIFSNEYFDDKERFADLLNGYLLNGQNVIQAEDLTESNSYVARIQKINNDANTQTMLRDVVKTLQVGMKIMLIVLQNQSDIHYAMPVRLMNEEAAGYHKQWRAIAKKHKKAHDLKKDEYISGFSRNDRLMPIMTIVVYFGAKPWDGPRNLRQMLDMDGIPPELRNMVTDYPIHILEVRRFHQIENFRTDLQLVFGFLQNCENMDNLNNYMKSHQQEFETLDQDAFDLIRMMSHSDKIEAPKPPKKGEVSMCKAIDDMAKLSEERGIQKGIQLTQNVIKLKFQNMPDGMIAQECHISLAQVQEITSILAS